MEKLKIILKNNFEIFFIKLIKVKESNLEFLSNFLKSYRYYTILKENNKYEILIAVIKKEKFKNYMIFNFLNQLVEKKIIYVNLIYLKRKENSYLIKELKIKFLDKKSLFFNQSFNNMKEFLKSKKDLNNIFFKNIIKKELKKLKFHDNFLETKKELNLLIINNFRKLNIKLTNLLNLLTLFGNIVNVYYNYYDGSIFIKYLKEFEIIRLLKNKYNLKFKDKLIDIKILDINHENILKKLKFVKEINFNKKINRFNKIKEVKYNPPNNNIIINNIRLNLEIYKIFNLLKKYSDPLLMKFIPKNNNKICFLKFRNIEDSINIIINLHNKIIDGKRIKISFSFYNF